MFGAEFLAAPVLDPGALPLPRSSSSSSEQGGGGGADALHLVRNR
jgi:hypothetical protein